MELIDLYDEKTGKKNGQVIDKDIAHRDGLWHKSVHILVFSKDKKRMLLQRRSLNKSLGPGRWDITVGGHVGTGEESIDAAKRELSEELGLNLKINYLKTIKEVFQINNIDSREFVDIYVSYEDIDLSKIVLQEEEVMDVNWFTLDEVEEMIKDKRLLQHHEEFSIIRDIMCQ